MPELQAMAVLSSRTTHAAEECLDACRLLAVALERALAGGDKAEVLDLAAIEVSSQRLRDIAAGGYRSATRDQVRGTGYVVDSLEAALWCFHQHDTFAGAVLEAANLGDDADTTAAVVGQLAGAFYGVAGIPSAWLARVHRGDEIAALADGLLERKLAEA
jgi:ADP-ribosyl-[dinitrogen reductase] hydrolase